MIDLFSPKPWRPSSSSAKTSGLRAGISKSIIFERIIGCASWSRNLIGTHARAQGVYVLQDNSFKPISRLSSWQGRADATKRAKLVCYLFDMILLLLTLSSFNQVCCSACRYNQRCTFPSRLPRYSRTRNNVITAM